MARVNMDEKVESSVSEKETAVEDGLAVQE
jgi:hypothetical protein